MFKSNSPLAGKLTGRRDFMDASGTKIGQIRRKQMPLAHMWYIGTPDNEKKCAVKAKK